MRKLQLGKWLALLLLAGLATRPALAETAEEFYRTQSKLMFGVPAGPGGTYDTYMRVLARYFGRYIPGNPTIIVQNVPAAGGLVLANQTFNNTPKNGTYIALIRGSTVQEHINGNNAASFDGNRFAWIGNMNMEYESCLVPSDGPVQSIKDLYEKVLIVGASGPGSQSYTFPLVYNSVLGMKFKVVSGYNSTPERFLAMERGELLGNCGVNTSAIQATFPEQYKSGKVKVLLQAAMTKDPRFANVPNILDEAKNAEDRSTLEYMFASLQLGRPLATTPDTPTDRVTLLRSAFDLSMKDPDLRAEAGKMQLDLDLMDGETTERAVRQLYKTPPAVVERVKKILDAAK